MGYFVGPLLLGAIADSVGLTTTFYVTSLILFAAMVSIQIQAKETLEKAKV